MRPIRVPLLGAESRTFTLRPDGCRPAPAPLLDSAVFRYYRRHRSREHLGQTLADWRDWSWVWPREVRRYMAGWVRHYGSRLGDRLLTRYGAVRFREEQRLYFIELDAGDRGIFEQLAAHEAQTRYRTGDLEDGFVWVMGAKNLAEIEDAAYQLRKPLAIPTPGWGVGFREHFTEEYVEARGLPPGAQRSLANPRGFDKVSRLQGHGIVVLPWIDGFFLLPLRELRGVLKGVL
jgi:hypothetical protein